MKMKKIKNALLTLIAAGLLLAVGFHMARPYITMRRIEVHLAEQPPGGAGPMFDSVNEFDRPKDVLCALWKLACDTKSKANESAGFILALIATEELSLAVPLEISEEQWWQSWGDFMTALNVKSGLTERELLVLGRIESVRPKK